MSHFLEILSFVKLNSDLRFLPIFAEERPRARCQAFRRSPGLAGPARRSSGMPPGKGEAGMPVAAPLVKFYSFCVKLNSISDHWSLWASPVPRKPSETKLLGLWRLGTAARCTGSTHSSTRLLHRPIIPC